MDFIISTRIYTSVYFKKINNFEDVILIDNKQLKEIACLRKSLKENACD